MLREPEKYCANCGEPLSNRGRSDRRFCGEGCKNEYYNNIKKKVQDETKPVVHALKQNRRILMELLGDLKTKSLTEKKLLEKGFQFKYHTHHFITHNGDTYTYCFDYGYLKREDEKYMIVKEIRKGDE